MRPGVVVLVGAVVLSVAGCATTRTTSPHSTVVSSQLAASQPVGSGAASTGLAASGPASSAPASSGPPSSQPASAVASAAPASGSDPTLQKLWDLAVSAATAQGGTIKAAQAVRSTHARAVAVTSGGIIEGDQPVWVIQVEGVGEFVCNSCSVPAGASAPHGRFQTFVVDASTFRTLDFGLSDTDANLTQLGTVVTLHP